MRPHRISFLLATALVLAACRRAAKLPNPSDSPAVPGAKPVPSGPSTLKLPLGWEDPAFAARWKQALEKLSEQENVEVPELLSKTPVTLRENAVPPGWKMKTDAWLMESGSLYRLGLSVGGPAPDLRVATRALQEARSLIDTPTPTPPFLPSAKLFIGDDDSASQAKATVLSNRYFEVQTPASASALSREACAVLGQWFSARQLLAGRTLKATARNKEALVLVCSLTAHEAEAPALPYLQVAELPLPVVTPARQEILFRTPADLIQAMKLQSLLEMEP